MTKIVKPSLSNSFIEFDEDIVFHEVNMSLLMALTFPMGYNESEDYVNLFRQDGDGNLLVSSEGIASENLETSKATISTSVVVVVSARANRKSIELFNEGNETVYIGKQADVSVATGYPLVSGSNLSLDNFIGSIYGIAGTGSNDVRVMELV